MELPITVAENDPVIRTSDSSNETDQNSTLRIRSSQLYLSRQRFDVGVMRETLLMVELETQGFYVDLRALSQLILSDLGATLQVLRLVGQEYGDDEGRPVRVEDCIADLGVRACIEAMSVHLMPRGLRSQGVKKLWNHSREIAEYSRHLAEQMVNVDPDQAYLVGLCHSIGSLASVLGLSGAMYARFDSVRTGLELATEWSLPGCVVDYFSDLEKCGGRSAWPGIVQAAHRCAGESIGECVSGGNPHPQLLWAV